MSKTYFLSYHIIRHTYISEAVTSKDTRTFYQ